MDKLKFTEGDWTAFHVMGNVCVASNEEQANSLEELGKAMLIEIRGENAEANAHLVAQAPKMYRMIEKLVGQIKSDTERLNHCDGDGPMNGWADPDCVGEAEILLARARGELNHVRAT